MCQAAASEESSDKLRFVAGGVSFPCLPTCTHTQPPTPPHTRACTCVRLLSQSLTWTPSIFLSPKPLSTRLRARRARAHTPRMCTPANSTPQISFVRVQRSVGYVRMLPPQQIAVPLCACTPGRARPSLARFSSCLRRGASCEVTDDDRGQGATSTKKHAPQDPTIPLEILARPMLTCIQSWETGECFKPCKLPPTPRRFADSFSASSRTPHPTRSLPPLVTDRCTRAASGGAGVRGVLVSLMAVIRCWAALQDIATDAATSSALVSRASSQPQPFFHPV